VPVPGASSVISALVASGLPTHTFSFLGFLPRTSAQRQKLLRKHADDDATLVVFESPHRVLGALSDIVESLGPERPLAVARELTKKFEEVFRGTAADGLAHFQAHPPRGEFTLVIGSHGK
jgi:16S rRNA (cytidine1402-2'-O)-methyltransferase